MNEPHHHSSLDIAVGGEQGMDLPARGQAGKRARIAVIVVGVLLAAGAARTIVSNVMNAHHLADVTKQNAQQYVSVVLPKAAGADGRIVLPGTLRGYVEAPIYSRASGYVLKWYADIGAHVQQGQLLAEIDTPEIDQELAQAQAQRDQSASTLSLAKTSFERAQQLRQRDAVSQQELDDRQGAYNQDVANLAAADANVRRLQQTKSFQRIVAPITGVITQRNVDIGDLVNSGNGGAGHALFAIAQSDPLRLYLDVPQSDAPHVALGQHVSVTQQEMPGVTFDGTVTHTSQAIDVATRTLQVEITLPNHDGKLLPGAYVQAALQTDSHGRLTVPGNALLFRAEGPRLAVVDADGKIRLKPVEIAQDLGQTLEIGRGIEPTDRVVLNPSDSIADGDSVVVVAPHAGGASGASGASGTSGANDSAKRSTT
ncbi:efflux RND transporter periplasmic adaptor subunit [Paraburkholderia tropica]|uniref:RND family efflux transporter MFP subunit n=1 Tax=Paraburkholderia tropica TaxID=92647 RepID=A0ABX5MJG5_9BURK|nr:efflux RND transporter periplasmic adaptor subunit [Paraburkholderia tropica]MBB3002997.1 RND family efflux transporter MFP subunit [Paraburkholderia tropica]MBB6322150.1 RND family efflux transporter MFP subunit [Paraburkholderia tropica]MDE1138051.1 efflux RND transporter periplasmic adaptor subunit [Paraburkholderia tropica]PXX12798.1 RND family efflux transporter MFP subunit [Paraburkholderia tropica]PZW77635.1 RND family efflux transporter MFP subunit [Paraburkholderia tropica]